MTASICVMPRFFKNLAKRSDQLMSEQYADSDSNVNAQGVDLIRILSSQRPRLRGVAARERVSDPVTEFIRFRITQWENEGKTLKALAEVSGMAKSMPSQIKARTSDATFYSATKLAGPFGYKNLPDLVNAAWQWWHSADRSVSPASSAGSPRTEAIALAMSYGVTEAQIARVLERFPADEFAHSDELWWLSRFHEQRSLEAEQSAALRAMAHRAESKNKTTAGQQAEVHEAKETLKAPAAPKKSARRAG